MKTKPSFTMNTECNEKPVSDMAKIAQTPLEFLKLFLTDELLNHILDQSNVCESQKNNSLSITPDELHVVLGAMLLSGYAKYPNKRLFWSGNEDVPKILQNSIRLNRFEQILRHIHFNNNDTIDKNDRLYKLRPLVTELNKNFKLHGGLEEHLSIDESMIPYYGHHYAKQFIRGKPIRFGFKNWALCSSSGYMVAFDIYTGKNNTEKRFGIGGDVVVSLIKSAEVPASSGFQIYFDNYFSSIPLFLYLTEQGYCATGTIQKGRIQNCPLRKDTDMHKDKRGTFDYRTSENNICLVRWKDNKVVTCITNFAALAETKCSRWSKEAKGKVFIPQPKVFADYNTFMGGVDKMDQLIAVYRTRMRQKKMVVAYFLLPIRCFSNECMAIDEKGTAR